MTQGTQQVSQTLDPQLKKRNSRQMTKKIWLGTRLPFLQISEERGREQATAAKDIAKSTKTTGQNTQYFESEHDKSQAAMGSRNGEAELQI